MKYQLSDFEQLETLGEGTFGLVSKVKHNITNEIYTLKMIKRNGSEGVSQEILREVALLKQLKHPNIITLEDIIFSRERIYFLLEFLDIDLSGYIKLNKGNLKKSIIQRFSYQILQGTLYFHSKGIIHRDIKPQNLLVNVMDRTIKIADFGAGRKFSIPNREMSEGVVTLWYRAPEILLGSEKYPCSIDIWSIGCVIGEMVINQPVFNGTSEIEQLFSIFVILGTPNENHWDNIKKCPSYQDAFPNWPNKFDEMFNFLGDPVLKDLLGKIFVYHPYQRITARDCLLHSYFGSINKIELPASDLERVQCPFQTTDFL